MIKIFPNRLEGEPLEVHQTHVGMTMREWLAGNAPDCDTEQPQFTMHINGVVAGLDCEFSPDDVVEVWVEPRGVSVVVGALIAAVVAVAVSMSMRQKMPKQSAVRQGDDLETSSLTGNVPRYGEPIPEIAGSPPRIYPDLLLPPHSYYESPRSHVVECLFCIGKGEFSKSVNNVFVGETSFASLGGASTVRFHEPGENLGEISAARWWQPTQEVGFTSRGGAGLELGHTTTGRTANVPQRTYTVSGDVISFPAYAPGGVWPSDWVAGTWLRISVPYPATISAGSDGDVIDSDVAFEHFAPYVGMRVELDYAETGVYLVRSYTPAGGGTPAVTGSPSSYTGEGEPVQLDFSASHAYLHVDFAGARYSIFLNSVYDSVNELRLAMAAQLNGTPLTVTVANGALRLAERGAPFTGAPIVISGEYHDELFGLAPFVETGVKTQSAVPAGVARMTLSTLSGDPVDFLDKGDVQLAIGPEGFLHQVLDKPLADVSARLIVSDANWRHLSSPLIGVSLAPGNADIGWTGPFTVNVGSELVDALEIDYIFPSGLIHYDKKGRVQWINATVFVEWRELGSTAWNKVSYPHFLGTPDALGFTQRIALPSPMRAEIRMRRSPKINWSNTSQDIVWSGLRGRVVGSPTSYAGVTTMSVKLKTGDALSSQVDDKVWLRATRILETLNGQKAATRDIAPFLLNIFKSCGYGEERIDMVALKSLDAVWRSRQDTFDLAVTEHSTVKRLASDVLRAGFAELVIDRGLLTPVRDARRPSPNYIYSPQEFIDYPTVTTSMVEPDEPDGVDAEYISAESGRVETVEFRLPGDAGRRAEKIQLRGVTDRTKAWRIAARHRRAQAYRRTVFKGTTEMQALNSRYMSYDRMQEGIPGFGQSCFVVGASGLVITLSEDVDWGEEVGVVGTEAFACFRRMDGTVTRAIAVTRGARKNQIMLSAPAPLPIHFGNDGRDPTFVYLGTSMDRVAHDVLVTGIAPKADGTVDITAINYDPRVYDDDDGVAP